MYQYLEWGLNINSSMLKEFGRIFLFFSFGESPPPPFAAIFQELNIDPATLKEFNCTLQFFSFGESPYPRSAVIFHRHHATGSPSWVISQTDRLCTTNQVDVTKEIKAQCPLPSLQPFIPTLAPCLCVGTHPLSCPVPLPSHITTMAESPTHRLDLPVGGGRV